MHCGTPRAKEKKSEMEIRKKSTLNWPKKTVYGFAI